MRLFPVVFPAARIPASPPGRSAGATTPMETMYLSAASTLISGNCTSWRGIIRKKPDVGLGVVGTYTLMKSPSRRLATSPLDTPVSNQHFHYPCPGHCTSPAPLHAWPLGATPDALTSCTEVLKHR